MARAITPSSRKDALSHQELAEPSACMKLQLGERSARSRSYGRFSRGDPAGLELVFVEPDDLTPIGRDP